MMNWTLLVSYARFKHHASEGLIVNILAWHSVSHLSRPLQEGDIVHLAEDTLTGFHSGCSTEYSIPYDHTGEAAYMVTLSGERHSPTSASTRATILTKYWKTIVTAAPPLQATTASATGPYTDLPSREAFTAIYTDGSFTRRGSLTDHIAGTTTTPPAARWLLPTTA
jgi:hypothetical protein